jgi:hypothetical protein
MVLHPDESRGPSGRISFKPLCVALLMLAIALPLVACGKRAPPDPPAGEKSVYPKVYPNPNEQ